MAGQSGRSRDTVGARLAAEPHRFAFERAVRILERAARQAGESDRTAISPKIAGDARPGREAVRLKSVQSLRFQPNEVTGLTRPAAPDGEPPPPPVLTVGFFGMSGPTGALPDHYAELIIARSRAKDPTLREFLDVFNHRLLSMFYAAGAKYSLPLAYERRDGDAPDPIARVLFALLGLEGPGLAGRQAVPDESFVFYAGHYAHNPRSAVGLQQVLRDFFGRRIDVEQFSGRWLYLAPEEQTQLGTGFSMLGVDAVSGSRVWDVQGSFRIRIGPLDYASFDRFLPEGPDLRQLSDLVRFYVGPDLAFDVQLVLAAEEVPDLTLGEVEGGVAPRLGWNTWLGRDPRRATVDDSVFATEDV